jgi:hypothetical protein
MNTTRKDKCVSFQVQNNKVRKQKVFTDTMQGTNPVPCLLQAKCLSTSLGPVHHREEERLTGPIVEACLDAVGRQLVSVKMLLGYVSWARFGHCHSWQLVVQSDS